MAIYLKYVYERLQQIELSTSQISEKWLINNDESNDWWLRAAQAKLVCSKLKIVFCEPSYYRDIKIWLPDVFVRTHFTQWQHNQRVRDAAKKILLSSTKLKSINASTLIMVGSASNKSPLVAPTFQDSGLEHIQETRSAIDVIVTVQQHKPTYTPSSYSYYASSSWYNYCWWFKCRCITQTKSEVETKGKRKKHGERGSDTRKRCACKCSRCI